MRNSFDLLNDIFDWCVADEEIMRMLSVTDNTNTDVLKNKLRLECQEDEAVTAAEVPFIAYYFTRAEKLEYNWLVNKGELYVDIYTDTLLNAGLLSKRFRQLLSGHERGKRNKRRNSGNGRTVPLHHRYHALCVGGFGKSGSQKCHVFWNSRCKR